MIDVTWQARGLIFENCSCQLLCPGHVSFRQDCSHERCQGHWALRIEDGNFGGVDLAGLNAAQVYDAPQRMYQGGWTQGCYIDDLATPPQRAALDTILCGRAGGPWAILERFVKRRLTTRYVPMRFEDLGHEKRLWIPDQLDTTVNAIRGGDRKDLVTIDNLHNVIHGATHVLGRGRTESTDPVLGFELTETHGLYSNFSWEGEA